MHMLVVYHLQEFFFQKSVTVCYFKTLFFAYHEFMNTHTIILTNRHDLFLQVLFVVLLSLTYINLRT